MFSLVGQFLAFHTARESMLSMLGWSDIDGDNAEFVKANVSVQTPTLLEAWHHEDKSARR
jgi:TetR/AcrR family transcriptional regulator, regulator of cefoperazone and chloramphenicol sensitivity